MAIGSLSDPDQLRWSRENARNRQSLLTQAYRKAKRSGNFMEALAVQELGQKAGAKIGGTVRAEDVAASGEADYKAAFEKTGKIAPPTSSLDAYKAMQPQARAAATAPATATAASPSAAAQASKPVMPSSSDITQQFRDRFKEAETDEDRRSIVSEAQQAGVPLSKFGRSLLAETPKTLTPPAPKMTESVGGKIKFTEAGRKYYEGLIPESAKNMLAESEQQRDRNKRLAEINVAAGDYKTKMKNEADIAKIESQFARDVENQQFKYNQSSFGGFGIPKLETEQARIKGKLGENLRDQMETEAKWSNLGLPKVATQFASERPDLVAPPRITPPKYTPTGERPYIPTTGPYQLGGALRQPTQPQVNPYEEEYLKGKAEYEKRQKAELERRAKIMAANKR